MSRLAPKTASRFGVIPHSVILNSIAESAIPFMIMVTIDNPDNSKMPVLPVFLPVSAMEKG